MMSVIDRGRGPAVVLIPGIQGRWEWLGPAVDALSARCRVLTCSLPGEPGSGLAMDRRLGFDAHVVQIDALLDRAGLERAALCGVSFGGAIAVRYAARRPARVTALVLASPPGPRWKPDARVNRYRQWPRLMAPVFVATAPARLYPEIAAAVPSGRGRLVFSTRHLVRVTCAPLSPRRMTARLDEWLASDRERDCRMVSAPTLILTGEVGLDRVVSVPDSRDYAALIDGARVAVLERTGHLGLLTRPDRFADEVTAFVTDAERRHEGIAACRLGNGDSLERAD
jgi:pimeloyl-ACP methyl ester carboxylesterase